MDEKHGDTSSDSDFGDSWTIVDKHSFCNRMMDAVNALECDKALNKAFNELADMSHIRDCALNFQDDSNNDADADSDGISVISESEEQQYMTSPASTYTPTSKIHTPPSSPGPYDCQNTQENFHQTSQPETRTPKKSKTKYNKPLTPPNTPVDCDSPILEKLEKKQKKRSYTHNRNDKVSNILNILLAGTIATAAGLAFGHLMGSKPNCTNLGMGTSSELTLKQLQYENFKLKSELKDLKKESMQYHSRFNKLSSNSKSKQVTNNGIPINISNNNSQYSDSNIEPNFTEKINSSVEFTVTDPPISVHQPNQPHCLNKNAVFFGPKTYADTINDIQIKDTKEEHDFTVLISDKNVDHTNNKNTNLDRKKGISLTTTNLKFDSVEIDQDQSKTAKNHSFPDLQHDPDMEYEMKNRNPTSNAKGKQSIKDTTKVKISDKKNSKTKANTVVKDSKLNTGDLHNDAKLTNLPKTDDTNMKSKKKTKQMLNSTSKKGRSRSTSSGKGDFGSTELYEESLEKKKTESVTGKPQKGNELEEQYEHIKQILKNNKPDYNHKDKRGERKCDHANNGVDKNHKNDKYPQEENFYKGEGKKTTKKEKKHSMKNIHKTDQQPIADEMKLAKDKRQNDKLYKPRQKDDRRKSDNKQENKDKYKNWEMKRGYEYYISQNDIHMDGLSEDENNKFHQYEKENSFSSEEQPVYSSSKHKRARKSINNILKDDSQKDNWAYLPLAEDSDTNNEKIDGSWADDVAKNREEQRNKENESDWFFERAKVRDMKRDKASWYFNRMNDREQCRTQENVSKHNTKRSSKKSPNYRSKL